MSNKVKADVNRKDMTKLQWTWHLMKQNWIGYVFVLPFMVVFLLFTVIPVVATLFLSLTSYNLIQPPKWVGFGNYIQLILNDQYFITAFKNTMIFAIATGPASLILSFVVAWFINQLPPKGRALMTLIFYAPAMTSNAYVIFTYFFSGDSYGFLNAWLMKLGVIDSPVLWFQNEKYIVPFCIAISLWMSFGTGFLAFIAGLQGVDKAQYEAGAVDGITNRWQELWYITLPNMRDHLLFGSIMAITGSFGYGAVVTTMTGGGVSQDYVGYTLSHHLGEYQDVRWEYGYAAAISLVIFFLCFGSNILVNKLIKKVGQ